MQWAADAQDDHLMRLEVLAFIEEHCRGLTLRDVRDWYVEAFAPESSTDDLNHP